MLRGDGLKILILEDDLERHITFRRKLLNYELTIVDNVKSAIEEYKKIPYWNAIFIDHDLGQRVYVPSEEENTGYQFAKFLSTQKIDERTVIVCHSMNSVGAQKIQEALPRTVRIPFPIFITADIHQRED